MAHNLLARNSVTLSRNGVLSMDQEVLDTNRQMARQKQLSKRRNDFCERPDTKGDLYLAVLAHRNTPTESMGTSPAQRLLGRRCKTQLPTTKELLKPQCVPAETVKRKTQAKQAQQTLYYNRGTRDLSPLEEGAQVRMRPFRLGKRVWEQAMVAKRHDERSYKVETEKGTYRRNRADLREQPIPQRSPQWTPPVQQTSE